MILVRAVPLLLALAVAAPAGAQGQSQPARERYVQLREGERCPPGVGDEVVVCGVLRDDERYRIPPELRPVAPADAMTNIERTLDVMTASDTGTNSCSNVGPGGFTGCMTNMLTQWRDARERARADEKRATGR